MRRSIIRTDNGRLSRPVTRLAAAVFWLVVWQLGAAAVGQEILLVSPVSVLRRWAALAATADFWRRAAFSSARILAGLLCGMALGAVLGYVSRRVFAVRALLKPLVSTIRALPVASFVILALIWFGENTLSAFIAFLICFPVFYTGVLSGLESVDRQLDEMAGVFRLSRARRFRYIEWPAVYPYLRSAVNISVGLAWKSGIAAEVIAIPRGSIGDKMYGAKIYLLTADLLAWTLTVVLLSLVFEKAFQRLLRQLGRGLNENAAAR